jgi:hypothetical protein
VIFAAAPYAIQAVSWGVIASGTSCAAGTTCTGVAHGDLDGVVAEKRAYNAEREDHKPENRRKEGGKAF